MAQLEKATGRISALAACLVLFSCAPSPTQKQSAACEESFGLCVAREVYANGDAGGDTLLQAFIVSGGVRDIVSWSGDAGRRHRGIKIEAGGDFSKLSDDGALAAVTLAAAAYNTADPYSDPEWLAVGAAFKDDPEVSLRAALLVRDIGFDPWEDVLRHPPGLEAIWRKVLVKAPDDFDTLLDLSSELTFNGSNAFDSLAREFIARAIALPNPTPEQQYQAASALVRNLYDADAAQALMDAGGYKAKDRDVSGEDSILATAAREHAAEQGGDGFTVTVVEVADIEEVDALIAAARLWDGKYSEDGARRFAANLLRNDGYGFSPAFETLQRGGAVRELRDIANTWLKRAEASHNDAFLAVQLYAGASDAFRAAGDKQKALAAARAGMPFIPMALKGVPDIPDMAERRREAGEDNGMSIAPAIALFRAGAEDEAVASGFIAGHELLKEWSKPLAEFDPQWIVADTSQWLDVTISDVLARNDIAFASRVYEALAAAPDVAEPMQLAVLAAAAGNAEQAQVQLEASLANAKSNPPGRHPSDKGFIMLRTVMAWKTSEMLLAARTAH